MEIFSFWFLSYCEDYQKPLNIRPSSDPAQFGVFTFFSHYFSLCKKIKHTVLKLYNENVYYPHLHSTVNISTFVSSSVYYTHTDTDTHKHTHFYISMFFLRMTFCYIAKITFSPLRDENQHFIFNCICFLSFFVEVILDQQKNGIYRTERFYVAFHITLSWNVNFLYSHGPFNQNFKN